MQSERQEAHQDMSCSECCRLPARHFGSWSSVAAVRLAANQLAEPAAFAGSGLWLFES